MSGSASIASDSSASEAKATTDPGQTAATNSSDVYCPAVNGTSWTLFREKCYHRYSAPFGIKGSRSEDLEKQYKTWFEAREECAKLGAKLASVHDRATHEKLLELIDRNENMTSLQETTWIGLQVGAPENVPIPNEYGQVLRYVYQTGCYWPAWVRPVIVNGDPCPENRVYMCRVTYNDTFHGRWEDGKLYDEDESADFWGPDEPSDLDRDNCYGRTPFKVDGQSRAYCERGVNGLPERRPHCAQILPADEKQIERELVKALAGKWAAFWCWMKNRAYICERPAKRTDGSEDSTSPGVGMQSTATTPFCGVQTTTRPHDCTDQRVDGIDLEINATRIGYTKVIETMALGGSAAGTTWLGGAASFADLAQSAIDFGRIILKLSTEDCIAYSDALRLQHQELSKKMDESYEKLGKDLTANSVTLTKVVNEATFHNTYHEYQTTRIPLVLTYEYAVKTLRKDKFTREYRAELTGYCERQTTTEDTITEMSAYFVSPAPDYKTSKDSDSNMLSNLVEHEPDSKPKVQLLMAEVDAIARVALTSLGICAQLNNVSERVPTESSNYVFNALAFLPDNRDDRRCSPFPKDNVVYVGHKNLNFFVIYANSSSNETAQEAWEKLKDNKEASDAVLDHVFSKSDDNLCGRLTTALKAKRIAFAGVAAVKCGYEFVWHELAHRYFYAAYSSTEYQWKIKGGDYDAKCGQIFFFP